MSLIDLMLILPIVTLLIGFVSMLFLYLKLLKRLDSEDHELKKHYLKKARTEAGAIVEEAGQEALNMLSASRTVSAKDQEVMESVVKQLTQDQSAYLKQGAAQIMQEFNNQVQQIRSNNMQALTELSKEITAASANQANEYSKALEQVKATTDKIVLDLNTQLEQIKKANLQALDMMSKTMNNASGEQTAEYNKALEQIKDSNENMITEFRTQLQQLRNYNINTLTNVSKDIKTDAQTQVEEYKKVMEQQTVESEKAVDKKIDDAYKAVEDEIDTYKNAQLKKVEAGLNDVLVRIANEVLEKSFNPNDHRDLIIQSLEKAKHEDIFTN